MKLQNNHFEQLKSCIPEKDGSVAEKVTNEWESPMELRAFVENVDSNSIVSNLRGKDDLTVFPDKKVNRDDVWEFVDRPKIDLLDKVLYVLGWGGMRPHHARAALSFYQCRWKKVVCDMQKKEYGPINAYAEFHHLKKSGCLVGMGPAYFTKLIYFLEVSHKGFIMDQWTARSMNLLRCCTRNEIYLNQVYEKGKCSDKFWVDNDRNDHVIYQEFCKDLACLAKALPVYVNNKSRTREEATELLLFSSGRRGGRERGRWRQYVITETRGKPHPGRINRRKCCLI